jgi:hypothetical protein
LALLEGFVPPQPQVLSERPFVIHDPDTLPTAPFDSMSGTSAVPTDAPAVVTGEAVFVDFERGIERRIRFDEGERLRAAAELAARGIHEPVRGDEAGDAPQVGSDTAITTKGLSWGTDDRQWHGLWPSWPNTTVGKVYARGGTGTFVGRRIVLTCAHCLVNELTDEYMPQPWYFAPREGGGTAPWGTLEVQGFLAGSYLAAGCTTGFNPPDCVPEDWALLILKDSFPLGHPGWLGYADLSLQDAINAPNKRSPGYPCCGNPHSPNVGSIDCRNCSNPSAILCEGNGAGGYQWGQPYSCTLGSYLFSDQAFSHGCDMSPGHSGGPVFYSQSGEYVIGVNSFEECDVCSGWPPILNPNYARRVDDYLYWWIAFLKAVYP